VTLFVLCALSFACAAAPALLFWQNLRLYRPPPCPPTAPPAAERAVSVLIPARDEEASIRGAVKAVLASSGVDLEVIVLDDHSEDRTAALVEGLAARDARVRLERAPTLPEGWCGKQHACFVLAGLARKPLLAFIDADVRLRPDALARAAAFVDESQAALASGFPRQLTVTFLERLLIPLVHFVLLGFLPLGRMRRSLEPAYGAGCGQFFVTPRSAYERAGGHESIRGSLHDGVKLPRAYRAAGLKTDLFDATELAECRMYRGARAVWSGLGKNATEGLGAPGLIVPATLVLLLGQVLPLPLAAASAWRMAAGVVGPVSPMCEWGALALACLACLALIYPRLAARRRFVQPLDSALLHPLGVLVLLAVQWSAFVRALSGRPAAWKGREYARVRRRTPQPGPREVGS
jgi:hypothetical protein